MTEESKQKAKTIFSPPPSGYTLTKRQNYCWTAIAVVVFVIWILVSLVSKKIYFPSRRGLTYVSNVYEPTEFWFGICFIAGLIISGVTFLIKEKFAKPNRSSMDPSDPRG